MSSSLFVRRSLASNPIKSIGSKSQMRLASTGSPINAGPSKAESQPQGSENRGKTTQMVLPLTAGVLAIGAFTWLFSKTDKKEIVPVGVNKEGVADKLKSRSVARAQEQLEKAK